MNNFNGQFITKLAQFTNKLTKIALLISAFSMIAMVTIIGLQVFMRYVLNSSPAWSEPVALLLMLYYILLAAAVGVYQGFHLGLKVLLDYVNENLRFWLTLLNYLLVGFFGLQMAIQGRVLANFTSEHMIPTLGISRDYAYWPFIIAGSLIVVFCIEHFLLTIQKKLED